MMQTPPPEDEAYEEMIAEHNKTPLLMKGPKSDRYIDDEYVEHQSTMSKQITRTNYNSPTSSLTGGPHGGINFIKDLSNEVIRDNARTSFLASAMKISSVKSPPQASF